MTDLPRSRGKTPLALALMLTFLIPLGPAWAQTGSSVQVTQPEQDIIAVPINPHGPGTGTVDANAVMTLENPALGQSERGNVYLGDENRALLYSEEFTHRFADFVVPGISAMDLAWTRTYRSNLDYEGPLGYGWTHNYNEFLEDLSGEVRYYDGTGVIHSFFGSGSQYYPGNPLLEQAPDGSFTLTFPDGAIKSFGIPNASGIARLLSIQNRNGHQMSFTYNGAGRLTRITDTLNRDTVIAYFNTGRIKKVTDPNGRVWKYGYTNANDLNLVTTPSPGSQPLPGKNKAAADGAKNRKTTAIIVDIQPISLGFNYKYFYDYAHNMVRCRYPKANRFKNVYNRAGSLTSHERGAGSWTFSYLEDSFYDVKTATVTDRNGNVSRHQMSMGQFTGGVTLGHLIQTEQDMNRGIHPEIPTTTTYAISYDNQGEYSTTTYPDGREVIRWYDLYNPSSLARGNIKEFRVVSAQAGDVDQVSWFIYEPNYRQLKIRVPARAFPSGNPPLIYNGGWTLDLSDPLVQQYQVLRYFDYEEIQNSQDYNGDGILGPDQGNVVKTVYPATTFFPVVAERKVLYNNKGMPLEVVEADGYRIRYFYWPASDPFGLNPASTPVSDYNSAVGFLAQTVRDYSEDPATIDPLTGDPHLNLTETNHYDARGNLKSVTDAKGLSTIYQYNNLNQLVRETKPAPFLHETIYEYNNNGIRIKTHRAHVRADGTLDPDNPWILEIENHNALDQLVQHQKEIAEGVFSVSKTYYDKNENVVLRVSPRAVSGEESAAIQSYVYDERDQVYSWTRGGYTAQFQTLAAHDHLNLSAIGVTSSPEAATAKYSYNGAGDLIDLESPTSKNLTVVTDGFGRRKELVEPLGNKTSYDYDLSGNVTVQRVFDNLGRLQEECIKLYDERSRLYERRRTFFKWVGGIMIPILNDNNGDGTIVDYYYHDAMGRKIAAIDDRGLLRVVNYDGAGRKRAETDSAGNQTVYGHDANGNLESVTRHEMENGAPKQVTSQYSYDNLNRLDWRMNAAGGTVTYEYDSLNQLTKSVDSLGNITYQTHGHGGLLTETTELREGGVGSGALIDSATTTRVYDLNGNLIEFSDGEGHKIFTQYDALDRRELVQIGDPAMGAVNSGSVSYYADGKVDTTTDPNGTALKRFYDNNGKMQSLSPLALGAGVDPLGSGITVQYNDQGLLSYADNGVCQIQRVYDSLGLVVEETLFIDGMTFTTSIERDGEGNPLAMSYPSGLDVSYTVVSDRNEIHEIKLGADTYFRFTYEGANRIVRRESFSPASGSNWQTVFGFDGANRLENLQHGATPLETLPDYLYQRNQAGAKTSVLRNDLGEGEQLAYDSQYQLVEVKDGVPAAEINNPFTANYQSLTGYDYDLANNREQIDEDGQITQYTPNHLNQISSVRGIPLTYDLNGNLTAYGNQTYVYDYANRMREARDSGNLVAEYFYDPLGRRVKTVANGLTEYELWFEARVVQKRGEISPGIWRNWEMIHNRGVDDVLMIRYDQTPYYLIRDDIGSATHLLDAQGGLVESYGYSPFGKPTIQDDLGNPLNDSLIASSSLFSARSWEAETGLYYFRSRYYHPDLGRFISRDTAGLRGGVNLYAYTVNNPVNATDPHGTTDWEYFLEKADPLHELRLDLTVANSNAKSAGVDLFLNSVGAPLTLGLSELIQGFNGINGAQQALTAATAEVYKAMLAIMKAAGPHIDKFMDGIQSQFEFLQGITDKINEGLFSGNFVDGPNGEMIWVSVNDSGTVKFEYPDGTWVDVKPNGDAYGEIPAGNGKVDIFKYDESSGTITLELHDGMTIKRFTKGDMAGYTQVELKNGRKFLYDDKGKLLDTWQSKESCAEYDEVEEPEEGENPPPEDF